jgi:predicted DNA-binding protein (MmcQ/YjbR family)
MNKTHWNSVKLNGDVSEIEVKRLVCVSYDLIKANVRKNK